MLLMRLIDFLKQKFKLKKNQFFFQTDTLHGKKEMTAEPSLLQPLLGGYVVIYRGWCYENDNGAFQNDINAFYRFFETEIQIGK